MHKLLGSVVNSAAIAGSGSGGASDTADYAPPNSMGALFDPGGRVDDPDTSFNTSTGEVIFDWNSGGGTAAIGGLTVNAPRFSVLITDLLPTFNPATHVFWVRLSGIQILNNTLDAGLAVFVSDDSASSGAGGGCVVHDNDGTGNDDRPGEASATNFTTGTGTGDSIDTLELAFTFADSGDMSVTSWVTDATNTIRNRGTRRNINFAGGMPAAGALYVQFAMIKGLSGALVSGDRFRAICEVGMSRRPA